jgi:hypothetical protein
MKLEDSINIYTGNCNSGQSITEINGHFVHLLEFNQANRQQLKTIFSQTSTKRMIIN